jgi:uncharacterized protein YqgC (DUF456 family)
MEELITELQSGGSTLQALAVTVGGLIGVFATLTVFFLIIRLANSLGKKSS